MTFYYAFIFPAGWLIASVTLTIHYWVDKFCLLRIWAPAPLLDNSIAKMSRRYFFSSALAVLAVMMSFNYASFPFDNACGKYIFSHSLLRVEVPSDAILLTVQNATIPMEYIGTHNISVANGSYAIVTLNADDQTYEFCKQDMLRYQPFPALPIPSNQPADAKWMSSSQNFTVVYAWTAVGVVFYVIMLFMRDAWEKIRNYYLAPPQPPDKPHPEQFFSDVKEIFGYVPQAVIPGALYPTLLCDVSEIDQELVGWDDPADREKITHNAIYDVPGLLNDTGSLFSIVKHWPPETADDDDDDE